MAESVKAWAIRPSSKKEERRFAPLFWEQRVAAIDYVGNSNLDLQGCTLSQLKEVVRKVKSERGDSTAENAVGNAAKKLWRFANEIRKDDWILSPRSSPSDVMIGRCISAYEYAPGRLDETHYPYIIGVYWYIDIPRDWLPEDLQLLIDRHKRQSLWQIDDGHISDLESLCRLAIEHRNVPVNLPGYLVQGVDELVGERGRSHFIVHVVLKELEETEK